MINDFFKFIRLIIAQKHLIFAMAKREVAHRHVGSLLGFVWTFINPFVLVCVLWMVFNIGFRVQPMEGVSFVVWLAAGLSGWFFFADFINGAAGIVVSNTHLIKKTLFHSQILPVVKLVSCYITHSMFILVLIVLILFQKMPISLWYLQGFYYLFAMSVFALGVGWALSALNVFFRDVAQVAGVIVQIGFWATPVFWDIQIMPPKLQPWLKLNPMFYIIQGYRESFIYFVPFWKHPYLTAYFWILAVLTFAAGALIFKKLKPQFPDVL